MTSKKLMNNLCRMRRQHNQIESHQRRMQTLSATKELDSVVNCISAWRMFFISLLVSASKYLLIMNCTVGVWNMDWIPSCNLACIGFQCCADFHVWLYVPCVPEVLFSFGATELSGEAGFPSDEILLLGIEFSEQNKMKRMIVFPS